ncbi:fimbrial protein [Pseudomonas chlororaphis]|uniref:fimbrial protein n=1 Tax=Pseudomonas chlororaphis TaxID=587753 RepID=UPI000F578D60|nr:fimbrial protein [Pseudomonas chlororaphis]AZD74462.1 Fimbrial protein [Pseudomonas chlororaphis subsp. aurantiaca]
MKGFIQFAMSSRWLCLIVFGWTLFGLVPKASAHWLATQCTFSAPRTQGNFGIINYPRDVPIGGAIGSPVTLSVSVKCPTSYADYGWYLQAMTNWVQSSAVPDTWTPFDGAPYSVKVTSDWNGSTLLSSTTSHISFAPQVEYGFTGTYNFTLQLYKSGPENRWDNMDASSTIFQLYSHNVYWDTKSPALLSYSVAGDRRSGSNLTCSIATPSIPVGLKSVTASELRDAGVAGDTPFTIGLTCPENIRLYATLTDGSAPGNTSDQLSLAPGSTASGVGLRILRDGTPLAFGPDSSTPGNTNQWFVGMSSGSVQIPLTAQYISTGTVTPGTVKGVATFTMSYQ